MTKQKDSDNSEEMKNLADYLAFAKENIKFDFVDGMSVLQDSKLLPELYQKYLNNLDEISDMSYISKITSFPLQKYFTNFFQNLFSSIFYTWTSKWNSDFNNSSKFRN